MDAVWLKPFDAVFGLGKESRTTDLAAWILRGDQDAFTRLQGRASKKKVDWSNLGDSKFVSQNDPQLPTRAVKLVRTVLDEEALVGWLARDCNEHWVTTYHAVRCAELERPPPERVAGWQPHLLRQGALLQLLRSVKSSDPLFAAAFRGLSKGWHATLAGELLAELGCEQRREGVHPRTREVRWLGPIVVVREKNAACRVFESAAEADTFVANLPPIELRPKPSKPELSEAAGFVAIWVDTVLDPKGTNDGQGGPIGWFDHDSLEADAGELTALLPCFTYAERFADAALVAAATLGLSGERHVSLLYDHVFSAEPGPMKKGGGWFLGSFPFNRT